MKDLYSLTEHDYVVDSGKIDYTCWVIRSTGNHPCAYVGQKGLFRIKSADELENLIQVPGGITYKGDYHLNGLDPEIDWIGWDYGHLGDYEAFFEGDEVEYENEFEEELKTSKKHTYEEIKKDIEWAIKCLEAIPFIEAVTGD